MRYICKAEWRDLEDRHLYKDGDIYPHDGRAVSEARIKSLTGTQNKAGFAVIEGIPEPDEEIVTVKAEGAKKATRSRKRAT